MTSKCICLVGCKQKRNSKKGNKRGDLWYGTLSNFRKNHANDIIHRSLCHEQNFKANTYQIDHVCVNTVDVQRYVHDFKNGKELYNTLKTEQKQKFHSNIKGPTITNQLVQIQARLKFLENKINIKDNVSGLIKFKLGRKSLKILDEDIVQSDPSTTFINIYSRPENRNIKIVTKSIYFGVTLIFVYGDQGWKLYNKTIDQTFRNLFDNILYLFENKRVLTNNFSKWRDLILSSAVLEL